MLFLFCSVESRSISCRDYLFFNNIENQKIDNSNAKCFLSKRWWWLSRRTNISFFQYISCCTKDPDDDDPPPCRWCCCFKLKFWNVFFETKTLLLYCVTSLQINNNNDDDDDDVIFWSKTMWCDEETYKWKILSMQWEIMIGFNLKFVCWW